jgi:hypothetical protein
LKETVQDSLGWVGIESSTVQSKLIGSWRECTQDSELVVEVREFSNQDVESETVSKRRNNKNRGFTRLYIIKKKKRNQVNPRFLLSLCII